MSYTKEQIAKINTRKGILMSIEVLINETGRLNQEGKTEQRNAVLKCVDKLDVLHDKIK